MSIVVGALFVALVVSLLGSSPASARARDGVAAHRTAPLPAPASRVGAEQSGRALLLAAGASARSLRAAHLSGRELAEVGRRLGSLTPCQAKASVKALFLEVIGPLLRQLAKKAPVLLKKLKPLLRKGWAKLKKGTKAFARWVRTHVHRFVKLVKRGLTRVKAWFRGLNAILRYVVIFVLEELASWALKETTKVIGNLWWGRRPVPIAPRAAESRPGARRCEFAATA